MWSLFPILTLRVGTGIVSTLVEKWVWVESGPPSVVVGKEKKKKRKKKKEPGFEIFASFRCRVKATRRNRLGLHQVVAHGRDWQRDAPERLAGSRIVWNPFSGYRRGDLLQVRTGT